MGDPGPMEPAPSQPGNPAPAPTPGGRRAFDPARLRAMHPADLASELADLPVIPLREALRGLPDELTAEVIAELPRR